MSTPETIQITIVLAADATEEQVAAQALAAWQAAQPIPPPVVPDPVTPPGPDIVPDAAVQEALEEQWGIAAGSLVGFPGIRVLEQPEVEPVIETGQ